MHRKISWVLCLLLFSTLVGFGTPGWTQESQWKAFHVLLGGGFSHAKPENTKTGPAVQGGVLYGLHRNFAVVGLFDFSPITSDGRPLGEGSLRLTAVSAGLVVRPLSGKTSPIVLGGGILQFSSFRLANQESIPQTGFQVEQTVQSSLGFFFGAGLDAVLSKRLRLWAYARYALLPADINVSVQDRVTGAMLNQKVPVDLHPLTIVLALSIRI